MDKTVLVMFSLAEGKRLVELLLQNPKIDLQAGFWYYQEDVHRWYLVLATPLVDTQGTSKAYEHIINVMDSMIPQPQWFEFTELYAKSPNDPLVKAVQSLGAVEFGEQGHFLRGRRVGGTYIDEAYVYFVAEEACSAVS